MGKHSAPGVGNRPADVVHQPPPNQGEPAEVRDNYDALSDKSGG